MDLLQKQLSWRGRPVAMRKFFLLLGLGVATVLVVCNEYKPLHYHVQKFEEMARRLQEAEYAKLRVDCLPGLDVVSEEECVAAGVAAGGNLKKNGDLVKGAWSRTPCNCFISKKGRMIFYDTGEEGCRPANYARSPVCKNDFRAHPAGSLETCPSGSDVSEEECVAAGLSVGGTFHWRWRILRAQKGYWPDKPCGCFVSVKKKRIGFNTAENCSGGGDLRYAKVCRKA